MNLSNEQLEIIAQIGNYEDIVLTGSAALILQGFKIRRKPEDIDFLTSNINVDLLMQVLCSEEGYKNSRDSSAYDNHNVIKKHGINVDFLYEKDPSYYTAIVRNKPVNISLPINNLCAKLRYTINDSTEDSVIKNAKDILYFIIENDSEDINLELRRHYNSNRKVSSPKDLVAHLHQVSGIQI